MPIQIDKNSIRSYLRCETLIQLSSATLNWSEFMLERHIIPVPPDALPEASIESPLVILWQGSGHSKGQFADGSGKMIPYEKRPGTISVFPPGRVPSSRPSTVSDLILWTLDLDTFRQAEEAFRDERSLRNRIPDDNLLLVREHFLDHPLAQLLLLLQYEAKIGGLSGPLYAESLAQAIVWRMLARRHAGDKEPLYAPDLLSTSTIESIVQRINSDPLSKLSITSLAKEAGYSYNRFFRAFRRTTGQSPHQYIIALRLDRAKELMRMRSLTLLEIALTCGFDSHAHFSFAFKSRFGISPSQYRQTL